MRSTSITTNSRQVRSTSTTDNKKTDIKVQSVDTNGKDILKFNTYSGTFPHNGPIKEEEEQPREAGQKEQAIPPQEQKPGEQPDQEQEQQHRRRLPCYQLAANQSERKHRRSRSNGNPLADGKETSRPIQKRRMA